MIFLTVGSQTPFDRLVGAMDEWAATAGDGVQVYAQIGTTVYRPRNFEWCALMEPADYRQTCLKADLLVSHAGMGTVLTALELEKPLLMLPRRQALRETRNDHQIATAKWLKGRHGLSVVWDESELSAALAQASKQQVQLDTPPPRLQVQESLVIALREFIQRD